MALACEVQGKLDLAIEWANKSYVEFGNKKGNYYSSLLRDRKADEARLDEQMKGK